MLFASTRRGARRAALASALFLALAAAPCLADEPASDPAEERVERSRALFDEARKLAVQDRWAEAYPILEVSHRLNPTGGTAQQLATCYEKTGQPDKAAPLWEFILARRPEMPPARVKLAEERLAAIREAQGEKPAKPEPGEGKGQPEASPPKPEGPTPPAAPPPKEAPAPSRVPAYVALGVGGAGVVVGSIFGIATFVRASEIEDNCKLPGGLCPEDQRAAQDGARTTAWASNIGFGVGVVGLAVGSVLLLSGSSSGPPRAGVVARPDGVRVRF